MSPKKICMAFLFLFSTSLYSQTEIFVDIPAGLWHEHSTTKRCVIEIPGPCQINIQVTGWQSTYNWQTDYDKVYIYNSDFEAIGYESEYTTENDPYIFHMISNDANLVTRVGQGGIYYIDFHSGINWGWPAGKTMQEYTVLVSITPANDTYEPNDDMNSATLTYPNWTITAAQWRRTPTNAVWNDEDWYYFNLTTPGRLTINLTNWKAILSSTTDYDKLFLYNSTGEMIGTTNDDPYDWMMFHTPNVTTVNYSAPGDYYLRFHAGNAYQTTQYTMETIFTPVDDQFEPNNEMWNANQLDLNFDYQAYQWNSVNQNTNVSKDEDYYKVSLPSAGEFKITLEGWHAILSWGADYDRMYVYDEAGNALGSTEVDPYFQVMMAISRRDYTLNVSQAGMYYVRLHSGDAYSINPYTVRFEFTSTTGVNDEDTSLPIEFGLSQNYPNPFNPVTTIEYQIPLQDNGKNVFVNIKVYDILGNEVADLINQDQSAGYYNINFDASSLTSGIYIYRLTAGNFISSSKMILLK